MELLMDPSILAGLLTLVVLEIVLGIDNLVFIAILADKLPPKQRDKARLIGLSLALIMRLAFAVDYFVDGDFNKAALYRLGFYLLRSRFNYATRRDIPAV
ncbi:Magnesium and cobalt efflux protein CorC [Salmonella enterica subsp. arizonae]|nr:Magnesium and cobalt efflux protein CorC [Salmonella enterica subsp. arizonae]